MNDARSVHRLTRRGGLALAVLLAWGGLLPAGAQESSGETGGTGRHYGNAPDQAVPFHAWGEPYRELMERVPTYPGPGRTIPELDASQGVRIGLITPLEGSPDAAIGQRILKATRLALDEANEAGGHEGVPFELVVRNDRAIWGGTANEMVALSLREGVVGVLGTIDGANSHVALRVALKLGVPMVNTACTDPTLTETMIPWIVRVIPDDRQNGYRIARFLFEERGVERVAALRVNDRYGRFGIMEFEGAARRYGRPLRQELRFSPGERGLDAQIARVLKAEPEAIVVWAAAEDGGHVVRRLREEGFRGLVVGTERFLDPRFLEEAGEAAEGTFATHPFDPRVASTDRAAFEERYRARFGEAPDLFAAYAYDGARLLIDAVLSAGRNRARIRDFLYGAKGRPGVTGPIDLDTSGSNRAPVVMMEFRGGAFHPVASPPPRSARSDGAPFPSEGGSMRAEVPAPRVDSSSSDRVGLFLPADETSASAMLAGAREEADRITTARGATGPRVELVVREDGGPWGRGASEAARLLAEPGLVAAIAPPDRMAAHVLAQVATRSRVPLLAVAPVPSLAAAGSPWVFAGAIPDATTRASRGRVAREDGVVSPDALREAARRAVRAAADASITAGGRAADVRLELERRGWEPDPVAPPHASAAASRTTISTTATEKTPGGGPHVR